MAVSAGIEFDIYVVEIETKEYERVAHVSEIPQTRI